MGDLMMSVRKVFNAAQDGIVALKCCEQLTKLKEGATDDEFWQCFVDHLQKTMIIYKTETAVERVIDFCAAFVTFHSKRKNDKEEATQEEEQQSSLDSTLIEENQFLTRFLQFLVQHHNARDKGVRYRSCQLITKTLVNIQEDIIDEDMSDMIYECMMYRIKDKLPSIRMQAVYALKRLQDPEDEECPVIDAFINSMNVDTSADVRRAVITNIVLSRKTLPYVINRTRDVKDINRKAAFVTLAEKVSVRALSIAARIDLLRNGLKDRSNMVRQACLQLLKAWLRRYDKDVVKLLQGLDTEDSHECSKLVLEAIFSECSVDKLPEHIAAVVRDATYECGEVKLPPLESLSVERVYYWYMLCVHLNSLGNAGEDLMQQFLPELTNFCEYIQEYTERNFIDSAIVTAFEGQEEQPEFILEHLLKIAGLLDLTDEVGRNRLQQLVRDLLVAENVPVSSVKVLVERYFDVEKSESRFIETLIEIVADVRSPMTRILTTAMKANNRRIELQLARIRMNLMEVNDDLEKAVTEQDFQAAASLKEQVAELGGQRDEFLKQIDDVEDKTERVEKNDPETLMRCLTITSSMLELLKSREMCPLLTRLKDDLIVTGIQSEDINIRNEAIKSLGILSLLNKDVAMQYMLLFVQVLQVDQELLQITAVKILFDILLLYGLEAFDAEKKKDDEQEKENEENDEEADQERTIIDETPPEELTAAGEKQKNAAEGVLDILIGYLDSESADIYTLIGEGMAKLLSNNRISSPQILAKLFLLWYNPVTEKGVLSEFFAVFAFNSVKNMRMVEEAFLPIYQTLQNAPTASPLSQVNIYNVTELLIQLTDVRNIATPQNNTTAPFDEHVHDSLAVKISNEIISDPEAPEVRSLCKLLNHFTICSRNKPIISDLIQLATQLLDVFSKNRLAKKIVQKFYDKLLNLMAGETDSVLTTNNTIQTSVLTEEPEQPPSEQVSQEQENEESENIQESQSEHSENTTLTPQDELQNEINESKNNKHKLSNSSLSSGRPSRKKKKRDDSIDFFIKGSSDKDDSQDDTLK